MWSIIKSHFHKGKSGFFITGLFVVLSVMMMIIGLSICLGMGDLYYNARNLSNSPDLAVFVYEELNGPLSTRIISAINERDDIECVDSQPMLWQEMPVNDNNYQCTFIFGVGNTMSLKKIGFLNIDDQNNKFKPYIRNQVSGEGFKIYVTGNYLITGHIGDKVMYRYNGENYWGYVAGVYDDMTKIYSEVYYYVENDFYQMVSRNSKTDESIIEEQIINVHFTYQDDAENAKAQLECGKALMNVANEYNYEQVLLFGDDAKIIGAGYNDRQTFKDATSSFILILGAAMITFSVIVAVIVALVIGFLVRSSVMDEVRNLGVFKALGYTTDMLRLSYLAIYSVISGICMIIGIILGITLMPTFVNIITDMARLECSKAIGLNVGSVLVAIALIISVISAVVMLATSRVKKVTPLSAMRNNFETHSFKRNLVPLAKSKLPVNSTLGVKSVTSEVNRSVMVVIVVLIMSLLCSFVSVVFYNLKVDQTAIINMAATENPDYIIGLRYEDSDPYFEAIRSMDGYQADMLAEVYCGGYIGDSDDWIRGEFFERFDILRTDFVYKGRYPKHKNEIIINEKFAKQNGFEIGDSFTVSFDELTMNAVKNEYVIVGYFQSIFENCHYMAFLDNIIDILSAEEVKTAPRMFYFDKDKVPTYDQITQVLKNVNNEENIHYGAFLTGKVRLGNMILNVVETAADAVMTVFIAVTAIIISLLLVMLIKLKLLRERRNYAIYKALGYTTPNIMTQIAVAMVILGVIGSLIGGIVGALITSPMLTAMGSFIGAGYFAFIIPWGYVVGIIVCIPLLIYLVSMLCAIPVRKIAPATLLRERG